MSVNLNKDSAYGMNQALLGLVSMPVISRRDPTTRDRAQLGQMWINRTSGICYFLTGIASNVYTWYAAAQAAASYTAAGAIIAGTSLTVGTTALIGTGLTVTAGGATIVAGDLSTTAGNIISGAAISATTAIQAGTSITAGVGLIATTGGITVAADGADITGEVDIAGDFEVAGEVEINVASADATSIGRGGTGTVDLGNITANSSLHGLDVTIKLGDAAGANELSITDSADAEVASINSDGAMFVASDITLGGAGAGPRIITGAGAPGALVAPDGSLYIRTDGGGASNTTLYVKVTAGWEVFTSA